jgi:small subunit ribosomal protein S1
MPEGLSARETDPWEELYDARDRGTLVRGTVVRTRHIDGQGPTWEVSLGEKQDAFGIRGLIPDSESGLPEGMAMSQLRNQVVQAKVKGIDRKNGIVALSRREAVEDSLTCLLAELEAGESLMAAVRAVSPGGIVVDVGGGILVRMSAARARLSRAVPVEAQYRVGQLIEVEIAGVDKETRRVSVAARDPWKAGDYIRGEMVAGKIVQISDNIAFVQVRPGLVGIAPYPKTESAKLGEYRDYQVTRYDPEKRLLHLVRWDDARIRERRRQRGQRNGASGNGQGQ